MKKKEIISNESGSIIVFVVVCLTAIVLLVGFVVDFGRITIVREQLKNAAESSAITAVLTLRKGCPDNAKINAQNLNYAQNKVEGLELKIEVTDIDIGRYSSLPTPTFSDPPPRPDGTPTPANAAVVTARMDPSSSLGQFKPYFFVDMFDMTAVAKAMFTPMDIMIVQDTSGSMGAAVVGGGTRITQAQAALNFMVNLLDPNGPLPCGRDNDYQVGMVGFNGTNNGTQLLAPLSSLIDDPVTGLGATFLRGQIAILNTLVGGNTPTNAGINLAVTALTTPPARPNYPRAIFLFSDGQPNNSNAATTAANNTWNNGIFLYTIYTGNNITTADQNAITANQNLSRPLSNSGGNTGPPFIGRYTFMANNFPTLRTVINDIIKPKITSW